MKALGLVAALLLGASVAAAQEAEPPTRLDPVVVTPGRMEQRASESPASVTVITREDIEQSASQTLDDLLRQVPGFSLFRRTSSLVGHPTTQGVSLRGIGPSGTSRALVLLDGVPINDPFGGWVYWNRVPLLGLEQVEVVRGGGSSVWGNYALGGVIHLLSRRPTERGAAFEASYGSRDTANLDLLLHEVRGPFRLSLEGNYFTTDGYKIVLPSRRGAIDVNADSEHQTFNGRLEWVVSPDVSFFLRGNYYDEDRGNGTRLQVNDTAAGDLVAGGRVRTPDGSTWTFNAFLQLQKFRSTFTTQAVDRNSETLALDQSVPTTSAGGALQWSHGFGSHLLLSGADLRWVEGETDEDVFAATGFLRRRVAGGEQLVTGAFLQDVFTPVPQWELVGGLRADYWLTYNASRRDTPPPAGVPARQQFSDVDQLAVSPRLAALWRATPATDLRASVYQGFRAPTLNELFRVFRVRNDVTVANEKLRPERLTGGELSAHQRWGPLDARVTGFWNDVEHLIANVTLGTRLPDCPWGRPAGSGGTSTSGASGEWRPSWSCGRPERGVCSPATSTPTRGSWRRPSSAASRASAWRRCPSTPTRWAGATRIRRGSTSRPPRASSAASSRTTSTRCPSAASSSWTSHSPGPSRSGARPSSGWRTSSTRRTPRAARARASSRSAPLG
jgi:outer membrane cobalamin receptor